MSVPRPLLLSPAIIPPANTVMHPLSASNGMRIALCCFSRNLEGAREAHVEETCSRSPSEKENLG